MWQSQKNSKPPVNLQALFEDDFTADNRLQFNGKFTGRTNVKFNAYTTPRLSNNEVAFGLEEDAQVNLKAADIGFQAKFKPNLISLQADFDHHLKTFNQGGNAYNFWLNPYVIWETSRALKNNNLHFGFLTHVNNSFMSHVALLVPRNLFG